MEGIANVSLINSFIAMLIGIGGSVTTARLYQQSRQDHAGVADLRVIAAGLVFGTTSWIVYLTASGSLLAITPIDLPIASVLSSIAAAVFFAMAGFKIARLSQRGPLIEIGGAVVGLSIVAVPLVLNEPIIRQIWSSQLTATTSAILAAPVVFGAVATSRVARPVTCYCVYGGASGLVLGMLATYAILAGIISL